MKTGIFFLLVMIITAGCGSENNDKGIEASGNIETDEVTVSAKTGGEIFHLLKSEGENVKKSDTIVIIEHRILELQLEQAIAGLKAAQAQYNLLKKGARAEDILQVSEALNQAEINLKLAEKDKDRMASLYDSRAITKKQFEDVTAKYEMALAQYNSAKGALTKIKNLARLEELQQAEANIQKQDAQVEILRKNINDAFVLSPLEGILVNVFIDEGETASPMSSLFKVADLNYVKLTIYVSEEDLGKVNLGQKASVSIDAYPGKIYKGQVTYISPEAEFTPKNIQTKDERTKLVFAVKIGIDNPLHELKPGMPADAVIHSNNK